MAYSDHFKLTDDLIAHLDTVMVALNDPFIQTRYTGFLSISAATVFEMAIKSIFRDFAHQKHKVLGHFTDRYFERLSGRIKIGDIVNDYVMKYGEKYASRFKARLEQCERQQLLQHGSSVKSSYGNLLTWRHEFAHEGRVPQNATYQEVKRSYELGKNVVRCLAESMRR